ncbi:MAG: hypothetical protein WC609_01870 [Candidatus Paceibacterota bacterium]|jgi:hypothetical protein
MFREEKNLKDFSATNQGVAVKDSPLVVSYAKTNKLVTALYMVTDIIDKDEPLRNKLRTLGTEIVSDMNSSPANACSKISEIMSFLDIASTINIISPMNSGILKKEFSELDQAIKESVDGVINTKRQISLAEFFIEELPDEIEIERGGQSKPIGHAPYARIGVQKGSTLLKAIKNMSVRMPAQYEAGGFRSGSDRKPVQTSAGDFNILKKQRRSEISESIQKNGGGATITDIKNSASGSLISCGEKTLQRELISMVKDGVLKKTGEKRWSKYFLVGRVS